MYLVVLRKSCLFEESNFHFYFFNILKILKTSMYFFNPMTNSLFLKKINHTFFGKFTSFSAIEVSLSSPIRWLSVTEG